MKIKRIIPLWARILIVGFKSKIVDVIFTPRIPKLHACDTITLGTEYGCKTFVPLSSLHSSTVISAGCGEDISFDIEMARKFNADIILIDPTPRAIKHVSDVLRRIGLPASASLNHTGCQLTTAYDLQNIRSSQLRFIPNALFEREGIISLFPPKNSSHVSYSFINISKTVLDVHSEIINCEATTIERIMKSHEITNIEILKLDIEGAQLEVIRNMFSLNIKPKQILIEIDELYFPSLKGKKRAKICFSLLLKNGYVMVGKENKFDFCFIQKSELTKYLDK
jgi:FkbM family methyltransferase